MSRIKFLCVVGAMSAWVLGARVPGAMGGFSKATLAKEGKFATLGATGTFSLFAYSEQEGVKNQTVTSDVVTNGQSINQLPPNRGGYSIDRKGQPISVPTGKFRILGDRKSEILKYLSPTARILNNRGSPLLSKAWLTKAGDYALITSMTGLYRGDSSAFITTDGRERDLFAGAYDGGPKPPPGDAAGWAVDPFFVPSSGSPLTYDPVLNDSIQLGMGESGGAISWEADSSVFASDSMDNYIQDGAPLDQSLWYLAIGGQGPITSTSDMGIDFELNPLALNEIAFPSSFLAGLGSFSDAASEAALIDQSIDQTVAGALTLNGNEVDLSGFNPFPAGTTFTAADGGVDYADGVDAGINGGPEVSGVPAPQAWLLFATGSAAFLGASRRRRKRSTA